MSKIIVLSDSGVGKTSWLFAMTGRKPLDVYRSTASEQFWFTQTTPAVPFLGVHAQVNDSKLSKLSAGADGVVVLYNDKSNPLHWLLRLRRLHRHHNLPIVVCCHGPNNLHSCAHNLTHHACNHCFTSLEHPNSIIDCANRIVTLARRNLASPLSDPEMLQDV